MSLQTLYQIYNNEDDAFQNLFDIRFEENLDFDSEGFFQRAGFKSLEYGKVLLRVNSFEIPSVELNTYEIHHKTAKISRPNAKVEMPTEFSFNVRVDRNYGIYTDFCKWRNLIGNIQTGLRHDLHKNLADIVVNACQVTGEANEEVQGTGQWRFKGCYVLSVGGVSLDASSGDPIEVEVKFGFLGYDDWFSDETPERST